MKMEELAVTVRTTPRSYLFSDKTGAFVVGEVSPRSGRNRISWTLDGKGVLKDLVLRVNEQSLDKTPPDSGKVYPHQVRLSYSDGTTATFEPLECGGGGVHGLLLDVERSANATITLVPSPDAGLVAPVSSTDGKSVRWSGGGRALTLFAGPRGEAQADRITLKNVSHATFVLLASTEPEVEHRPESLWPAVDSLRLARKTRMEQMLDAAYFRCSDEQVTRGLCWIKLSLDALVVKGPDTMAVAGIPWDGGMDGRENAIAIPGLGLATGDYAVLSSISRTLARSQETRRESSDYGRIADRVQNDKATYHGADVAPWFVRNLYEYVTSTNDTALVRAMYPIVKRSIEGTLKYHTDSRNLLVHADGETWMNAMEGNTSLSPRGNRAVEIQLLWQFQQMIGSFVASFVNETGSASLWKTLAGKTEANFNKVFIDTTDNLIYDHVKSDGVGVLEERPNPLFCLEILGSELVQQNMIKKIVNHMFYEHGVGTLAPGDPAYRSTVPAGISFNGPVATWLIGQMTYALSRYDRQDLAYRVTRRLVRRALEYDMVGTLPAMMEVSARSGEGGPAWIGAQASLAGMAEFVRSVYQDYLGVRIDAPSHRLSIEPKLPAEFTDVDFTIHSGHYPVRFRYQKEKVMSRVVIEAPELDRDYDVSYLWILDDGNGWQGTTTLTQGTTLTLVFGPEEVLAYRGEKAFTLPDAQRLKGFSLRESFRGIDLATPPESTADPRR